MWAQLKAAKSLITAVLIIALSVLAFYLGGIRERGLSAARERDWMADKLDSVLAEQAQDRKRAERLQKTLDKLPKAERKHADVVRANPAGCDRPAPVADSLQRAVDEANAARKVSGDS